MNTKFEQKNVDFKKLTEHILRSYLDAASEDDMGVLELLDEDMSVIGTGKQEFYRNLQEFSRAFVFEVEQREKVHFEWQNFENEEKRLDASHTMVYGTVLILGILEGGDTCIRMDSRFTVLYGLVQGVWKVLHIHHSVPDKEQLQGEEFPRTLGQQIEESQNMVAALTADYLNVYVVEPERDRGMILKLNGYEIKGIHETEDEFVYSDILRRYAQDRVCDEDRDAFLNIFLPEALKKSFAEGRERLELNYRVPIDGSLEHYSGLYIRISKATEPLKLIAGFRSTEDIITLRNHTRQEGLYSAYAAVSDLYLAMFRINIQENTYVPIKTTEAVSQYTAPQGECYDRDLSAVMMGLADADSLDSALEFLDPRTIEERLEGKTHIFAHFTGKVAGACKLHLIREDADASGRLCHVILAVEVLEDGEYQPAFEVLSRGYQNVFLLNPDEGKVKRLKLEGAVTAGRKVGEERRADYETILKEHISGDVYSEDRELLYEKINLDHLREIFEEQDEYAGTYRVLLDGEVHNYQYNFIRPRGSRNIVCGFQNIDAIVEEHVQKAKREQKRQEALSHALAAAQQANKAKTTFLNNMSHDIRTPMNAIIGFTALAQAHIDNQDLVQNYLGKIGTSGTHLLSLINDILDMSRIESGTVRLEEAEVTIPELMEELRTMIQSLANSRNQSLTIDLVDVVHEKVFADKLRLSQVFLNITGNAIKFTQPGGEIHVCLTEKPCGLKHYATYVFTVKDNGIGMSKEYQKHIFETFSREYNSTISGIQGTGLGMAITKNIVDLMGGDIRVESEEGKGTLFTVTLDLRLAGTWMQTEPPAGSAAVREKRVYDYRGRRVLLVEDNELNREIATSILEDTGMTVDSVNDGDEAVAAIQAAPADCYDLIFMDIQMPKMDGYAATRAIRALSDDRKAKLPIVALSANAFEEDKRKSHASGMNGHISKPISIEAIAKVLDTIWADRSEGDGLI